MTLRAAADDESWMRQALRLAREGEGLTRPNPPVGAVLVRDGEAVGEGYHHKAGEPHAEILALRAAGDRASGATLYVTLEPCCTTGRTPPCTTAVLDSGVRRIVVAARDPNPAHEGRGIALLRRRGLEVRTGVLCEEAERLIAPFRSWIRTGRPYVTLKLAITLDGRIADRRGRSRWITGPAARRHVQALRRRADAVMIGAETARTDNPSLLPRPAAGRKPWRVVVTGGGGIPPTLAVCSDAAAGQTLLAAPRGAERRLADALRGTPVEVLSIRGAGDGISLRTLLSELGRRGCLHVLCEGGGRLAGGLVKDGLVDEFIFFIAPSLLGGGARGAIEGAEWLMQARPRLRILDTEQVGKDLMVRAAPARGGS